ncbi:TonB-dependent receptor plug domain-containing protein [Teredinibacter haidensis]|uniref:TonB-dependent receptor plug domain-containing protein n=1 Tax=Teredinibacter haidensis TaxID=2731755 RepID=UPI0009FB2AF3|nr:TonB-dependent receptor [Teredinibacter haidensis]
MGRKGHVKGQFAPLILLATLSTSYADLELYDLSLEDLLELKITSASKFSNTVRDIPASVTVITRDDISLMGYSSLEELLINIPGFYHVDTYEDFQIGVRGTVGGSLAFLVNGILQHPTRIKTLSTPDRSRTNIPIDSIDRIEVVRGPSSVIYGNNAFFGSINIVTNNHEVQGSKVSASIGDNGYKKAFARLAQTSVSGYSVLNLGGVESNGIGGNLAEVMSEAQLNHPLMQPGMYQQLDGTLQSKAFNADLTGAADNIEYGFRYSERDYGFYALFPGFGDGNQLELKTWNAHLGHAFPLNDSIETKLGATLSSESYFVAPDFIIPSVRGYQYQSSNRMDIEGLLTGEKSNDFGWVLGANYSQLSDIKNDGDLSEIGFYNLAETDKVESSALFTNVTYEFSPFLHIEGGFRLTRIGDYSASFTSLNEGGDKISREQRVLSRTDDAVKLSGIWAFASQDFLKFLYSTATQDNSSIELVEPEHIRSYELNYLHAGKKNTVSISLFDNDIQKVRRRILRYDAGGVNETVDNQSQWKTQGVEFILTFRPNSRLTTELSGVYQESDDAAVDGLSVGYSPNHQLKFKMGYGWSEWKASSSVVCTGEMYTTYRLDYQHLTPEVQYLGQPVDGYTLVNSNLRYQKNNSLWYLNLHAFNLLDSDIRYPANELANFEYGAFGPARQITLTLGMDFE